MSEATRRSVLAGAAGLSAVGLSAAAALAACGDDAKDGDSGAGTGNASSGTGNASTAAGALGAAADIPVGGGKVFAQQKVVVTQPTAGQFKAFDAVCTHASCVVASVANGLIKCPCHGSAYKVADGSVANGPAAKALSPKTVKVENGQITLA
jgi:nitrite reductase/ring-hydroxylating ferredoxin subunit